MNELYSCACVAVLYCRCQCRCHLATGSVIGSVVGITVGSASGSAATRMFNRLFPRPAAGTFLSKIHYGMHTDWDENSVL